MIGKAKFRKGLGTKDRDEAIIRAGPYLTEWRELISGARDQRDTGRRAGWVAKSRLTRAEKYKAREGRPRAKPVKVPEAERIRSLHLALRDAKTDEEREGVRIAINDWLGDEAATYRDYGNEDQLSRDTPEVRELAGEIFAKPTLDYIDDWIASLQVTPKTAAMRRSTVTKLAETFPTLGSINRKDVRKWTRDMLASGLAPATVQRMASDARTWYLWLVDEDVVAEGEPFNRLGLKVKGGHKREHWEDAELLALHKAAKAPLKDLIELDMYSGARLAELVNLKVEDVKADHFKIREAKSESGVRSVPIHPKVRKTFARLIEKSKDGYLLAIGGKNRSDTMSKAFQRLRKDQGHTDPAKVFHSIRHTVVTKLRRAKIDNRIIQQIIGHSDGSVTGGYGGGFEIEECAKALSKLKYA